MKKLIRRGVSTVVVSRSCERERVEESSDQHTPALRATSLQGGLKPRAPEVPSRDWRLIRSLTLAAADRTDATRARMQPA